MVILALVVLTVALTGCATLEQDGYSEQPWNVPAGWESSAMGMPY
jgi:hypothetical protein